MPDVNTPHQHLVMGELTSVHDTLDEEDMDDMEEGKLGYKKTKRERRSGHKIQGYRRQIGRAHV